MFLGKSLRKNTSHKITILYKELELLKKKSRKLSLGQMDPDGTLRIKEAASELNLERPIIPSKVKEVAGVAGLCILGSVGWNC